MLPAVPPPSDLTAKQAPPACPLPGTPHSLGPSVSGLTSLLHEAEQVIQELLPLGVPVQFVELWGQGGDGSVSVRAGHGRRVSTEPKEPTPAFR